MNGASSFPELGPLPAGWAVRHNRGVIVSVAGRAVGVDEVGRRGPLNLGRPVPGWAVHPYRMEVTVDDVVVGPTTVTLAGQVVERPADPTA